MKRILEPIYQRQLDILDYLLLNNKNTSLNKLSYSVSSSESTVLRDLNYFEQNFNNYIQIERNNFKEIQLINTSSQQIKQVQSIILNSSLNIGILTHIFLTPFKTIDYYSSCLNVSNSSILKNIKEINNKLKDYQIQIKRVSQKYFIFANSELLLRELFTVFWVETHLFDLDESVSDYADLINQISDTHTDFFINSEFLKSYYLSFIFVSIVREKGTFLLTDSSISPNEDSHEELIKRIKKSILYSPYTDNIFFNNRNFYKLTNYLQKDLFGPNKKEDSIPLFNIIRRIYENEISYQIPVKLFIGQLTFFYNELKKNPRVEREINVILVNIEKILHISLDAYIPLLSYMLIVYYPMVIKSNTNRNEIIYIYSSLSKRHSNFLIYQLNTYFDNYYQFQIIEFSDLYLINNKSLIITNDHKINLSFSIIVDDYITKNDFKKIESQIVLYLNKESSSKLT